MKSQKPKTAKNTCGRVGGGADGGGAEGTGDAVGREERRSK